MSARDLLWQPSEERIRGARMTDYREWLNATGGLKLDTYQRLWRWSVDDLDGFWGSIWSYFDVAASAQPTGFLPDRRMPGAEWFPGARLNFAENVLRHADQGGPAIIALAEGRERREVSWAELRRQVASLAARLRSYGVGPGDRVAAYLPNLPETVIALLATASVGAVWACCAPDYGAKGAADRLRQIGPTVLVGVDGYRFGGKDHDRLGTLAELAAELPTVQQVVVVRHLRPNRAVPEGMADFAGLVGGDDPPAYKQVPFQHPLWILYSSGTTGLPKGIVHSHGGILLDHLKMQALHFDCGHADRVFIYASTAWMVWNVLATALAVGSTIITYEGSPVHPEPSALFAILGAERATRFGTGAGYLTICEKAGLRPGETYDLAPLRSVTSTGSPLPASTYRWVYDAVKRDVLLGSDTGGTDVCGAFIGSNPLLPVYAGELQAPFLGVDVQAWDSAGRPIVGEVGELVVTKPMPSMPVHFWNDPDGTRYRDAYFGVYPGIWRHGDWMTVTSDGTYTIHGRSDSTINRGGVRMGSADIYAAIEELPEIADSLVIGAELPDGGYYMPLFVVLKPGAELSADLVTRIRKAIGGQVSPRHVPDEITAAPAVPRTLTGKKLEVPIKRLLQGVEAGKAVDPATVDRPAVLDWYVEFALRTRKRWAR